jgi:hypothetical protein
MDKITLFLLFYLNTGREERKQKAADVSAQRCDFAKKQRFI